MAWCAVLRRHAHTQNAGSHGRRGRMWARDAGLGSTLPATWKASRDEAGGKARRQGRQRGEPGGGDNEAKRDEGCAAGGKQQERGCAVAGQDGESLETQGRQHGTLCWQGRRLRSAGAGSAASPGSRRVQPARPTGCSTRSPRTGFPNRHRCVLTDPLMAHIPPLVPAGQRSQSRSS